MTFRITYSFIIVSILFNLTPPHQLKSQTVADTAVIADQNQFGLTIWNFGLLGNGYNLQNGEIRPSAQYKLHPPTLREQVEHFAYAGLWVGGSISGEERVSTAMIDGAYTRGSEGFEFRPLEGLMSVSSNAGNANYDPTAVSHQDYITRFTDLQPLDGEVPNHNPLGIEVLQRSLAWDYDYSEAFIILDYTLINVSSETIEDIYTGIWMNPSVANMNYTSIYELGGGFTWYDNLQGFDESVDADGFSRNIAYQYDADGDDGWAESYVGVKTLGGSVSQPYLQSFYNQWPWNVANNVTYPDYDMAVTDAERYTQLSSSVPPGDLSDPLYKPTDGYPSNPNSWMLLQSAGPLGSTTTDSVSWSLPPGDSCFVVFALVAARWAVYGVDGPERRGQLYAHADWAQQIYDGEDRNRNGRLDPGEDRDSDGTLDRYLLPPGVPQNLVVEWSYPLVTLRWDAPLPPVTGYNIYRSRNRGIFERINTVLVTDTLFSESGVSPDSLTAYYVTGVNEYDEESAPSNIVKDYSTPPQITFQHGSNPLSPATVQTYPTRTFSWEVTDVDGQETISTIAYALDDTSSWIELDGNHRSVTLRNIPAGNHIFYVKAIDDFGFSSPVIYFPDSEDPYSPGIWEVLPIIGDVLLVDDFPFDQSNNAMAWYRSILDTIPGVGASGYSIWEVGDELPFSETDVAATLGYFKRIIWYSAFVGPETYGDATNPIHQFVQNGGNIFLNAVDLVSPPPIWFPFDSTDIINPSGRLFAGTTIESSISTDLDLESSKLIAVRLHSFAINDSSVLDPVLGPSFTPLYQLPMPSGTDPWIGTPIVAAKYDHRCEANEKAGEVVLFTIPLHDGVSTDGGMLEGYGSAGKFVSYVLRDFTVDVEPVHSPLPVGSRLYSAYPNPFNPTTTLRYDLPHASEVSLIIYDLLGREVARLVDGYLEPGYHEVQWDGRESASGIYIARLRCVAPDRPGLVTPGYSKSIKMLLLK